MKKIPAYLSAYLALIGFFVLGAWFIWRGMDALSYILAERILNTTELFQTAVGRQSSFIVMGWAVTIGLLLLITLIFAEAYFRNGVAKGNLPKRIAILIAPELVLIFAADLIGLASRGWIGTWIYWLVMVTELAAGGLLFLYGRTAIPSRQRAKSNTSR